MVGRPFVGLIETHKHHRPFGWHVRIRIVKSIVQLSLEANVFRGAEINQHPLMAIATTTASRPRQASVCCPNSVSALGMSRKACLGDSDLRDLQSF